MLKPDYPVETDRLVLRPFEAGDLDDYHAYRSRPDVYRYLYGEALDRQQAGEGIAKKMAESALAEEGQGLALAVYWPEAGRVVGDVVLKWLSKDNRQGEIGYGFNPEFQGKGLATEAAAAMLRLGFEDLGLHRIVAECDPRNEPSWRLMERLGMRREAHFRQNEIFKGEWGDLFVYALLNEECERAPCYPTETDRLVSRPAYPTETDRLVSCSGHPIGAGGPASRSSCRIETDRLVSCSDHPIRAGGLVSRPDNPIETDRLVSQPDHPTEAECLVLRPDYPIKTDRLVLRPFEPTDLDDVFAYRRLPEVNRYLYSEPGTREDTAVNLAKWTAQDEITENGNSLALAVTLDGQVIGEADLKLLSAEHRQGEIGYIFNPAFQGQGYASEAARALLRLGFEELGLHRIQAACEVRNEPSWRVMERLGMRREAHFRHHEIFKGEWADCFVYAMLAEEHRTH